jgi:hypothetical protein
LFFDNTNDRLGVGTASPAYRLSSKQSGNTGSASLGVSSINSANDTVIGIGYDSGSDTNRVVSSFVSTGAFKPISFWTSDLQRMQIDTSGNLLVGTTTDTIGTLVVKAKNTGYGGIQVVIQGGSDYWTQNVDTVSGYTWGKNGADFWHAGRSGSNNCVSANGSWVNSSDERLKKNIKTLTSALEKITAMRGVEFDRKNNDSHEIGLIAQEVLLVYPEAVEKNGDFLGLNYGSLIGPLIEAIKELKAEFDAYKLLHP